MCQRGLFQAVGLACAAIATRMGRRVAVASVIGGCVVMALRESSTRALHVAGAPQIVASITPRWRSGDVIVLSEVARLNQFLYAARQSAASDLVMRCYASSSMGRGQPCHLASLEYGDAIMHPHRFLMNAERAGAIGRIWSIDGSVPASAGWRVTHSFMVRDAGRIAHTVALLERKAKSHPYPLSLHEWRQ